MNQRAKDLMRITADLAEELRDAEAELKGLRQLCIHHWGPTEYAPEIREAYRTPGDTPGTMGIDWQPPVDVPRQETPMWTRRCLNCDLAQTTHQTNEHVTKTPRFP
jgi:hypothetical protein